MKTRAKRLRKKTISSGSICAAAERMMTFINPPAAPEAVIQNSAWRMDASEANLARAWGGATIGHRAYGQPRGGARRARGRPLGAGDEGYAWRAVSGEQSRTRWSWI